MLLASAGAVLILAPGMAVAGADPGGNTDDDAEMIAAAKRTEHAVVVAYNDRRWDELGALYAQDAVMLPPNHEPIQGRGAIIEFLKSVRDAVGAIDTQTEYVRVTANEDLVDLVATFTTQSGGVRMVYQGLYERQPDGSVLLGVDHFALRDPVG